MRDVLKTASKILFYALALVVLLWTAGLTLDLAVQLLPGESLMPFFILALFDGGALAWCLVFLFQAQGLAQRAISLLMMVMDLIGVIGMSIAALFLSGQQLTAIPEGLGTLVVWTVGVWTALNVAAIYAFHIADPEEMQEIRLRTLQDKVTDEAIRQVETDVHLQAQSLAGQIAAGMRADVLARLRLPAGVDTSTGAVIDVTPVNTEPVVRYASDVPEGTPTIATNPTNPPKSS